MNFLQNNYNNDFYLESNYAKNVFNLKLHTRF